MKHMTIKERGYIEYALKKKTPIKEIALALGYSRVSIYAEIKRGMCKQRTSDLEDIEVYLADYAQRKADEESQKKGRHKKLSADDEYLKKIASVIKNKKYSPYAAGITYGFEICEKTIYNYIHAGYIPGIDVLNLPYAKPKKKKIQKRGKRINQGKSIVDRPRGATDRSEFGHWEIDTVYSSRDDLHCLLTLTERMTRDEIIVKINDRTANSVCKALNSLERKMGTPKFRDTFKSITADNGVEFSDWETMEKSCRTKGKRTEIYFAHAYCSWERGTNENHNRMIRRWIPKGDDIGLYTTKEIKDIEDWMNNYPRRMYNGLSANQFRDMYVSM